MAPQQIRLVCRVVQQKGLCMMDPCATLLSHLGIGLKYPNACFKFVHTLRVSSLKVKWRKEPNMDEALLKDKKWRLCMKVVREVVKEPGQVIAMRYLEKRRERLGLSVRVETFLKQQPGLFEIYMDSIKPKSQPVKFLRISDRLAKFLKEEKIILEENESLVVDKLTRILMMTNEKKVSVNKLVECKRDFGFPDDLVSKLIPKYPNLLRIEDCNLELVRLDIPIPVSCVERRAQEESLKARWPRSPTFRVCIPPGMRLKKDMLEWTRNWMERPYISPYMDSTNLDPASLQMEKRTVGLVHELLSLTVFRRIAIPTLGKFCDDFRLPNAFPKIFTRHPGMFYLSRKGGIETAMLREAYDGEELIDKDPLLVIKDKFCQLLEEGSEEQAEKVQMKHTAILQETEAVAIRKQDGEDPIKNDIDAADENNDEDADNNKAKKEHYAADVRGFNFSSDHI